MNKAGTLRNCLKERFYPFISQHGFNLQEPRNPRLIDFRRSVGDNVQNLTILWAKYGQPRFVVDADILPADSPLLKGSAFLSALEEPSTIKYKSARLKPGLTFLTCSWFRLDRPILSRMLSRQEFFTPDQVVDQLMALYPEIEVWLKEGVRGPHLSVQQEVLRLRGSKAPRRA